LKERNHPLSRPHHYRPSAQAAVKAPSAADRQADALERLATSIEQVNSLLGLLIRHLPPTKVTGTPRAAIRIFDVTNGE
jgi:hypothetical protein